MQPRPQTDRAVFLAACSIAVGVAVLALKYLAFRLTGSVALYSDALESIINVAASVAALVALRVSRHPADANHPFGHSKAEYFSAVIEGVLIVLAALAILREAYLALLTPKLLESPGAGMLVSVAASAVNALWATYLIRSARRLRSPALLADGKHIVTDVISSLGVLVGVGLAWATGVAVIDPVVAGLVALNILWSGWALVRDSVNGLMDEAAPGEVVSGVRAAISAHATGALEAHDLRTRIAGSTTFVEFHLIVPGSLSVTEAHAICDRLEDAIKAMLEGAVVTIHVEPEGKAKHRGVLVVS
jgi:cation diffusion facilitator family transporter